MDNPLTYLNSLFDNFAEKTLSGHDQLIMLHIYNVFNRSRWPETVRISDRDLQLLCRFYDSNGKPATIDTIRRAKGRLKLKGLIDYTTGNGQVTEYSLPCLHPVDTPVDTPADTPVDTPVDTPADTLAAPYIPARVDLKTLDFKTVSTDYLLTRARETSELDDILEYWERTVRGGRLTFEHQAELANWLAAKGGEWVKAAMKAASDANGNPNGTSFKLLRAVVERLLNQKPQLRLMKGGEKSGGYSYAKPTNTIDFDAD